MLRGRIAATGASLVVSLTVALASATAQTAGGGAADRPLPLLQIVGQNHNEKLRSHPKLAAKRARRTHAKTRLARHVLARTRRAERTPDPPSAAPAGVPAASAAPAGVAAATAAPADSIWPAADATMPGGVGTPAGAGTPGGAGTPDGVGAPGGGAALAPQQPTVSFTTEPVVTTDPNQIAAGSHTVQAGSPSGFGPPEVAAGDSQTAAPAAGSPTGSPASADKQAAATPAAAPAMHVMSVKAAAPSATSSSQVGSASWIAQVLAALGGAIAAGVVAWFLIGPAAARRYG